LVVVLTACYDDTLHAWAMEEGAAIVLDKVTCLGHLVRPLRRLLANERLLPTENEPS
jgi:hypothetical protein